MDPDHVAKDDCVGLVGIEAGQAEAPEIPAFQRHGRSFDARWRHDGRRHHFKAGFLGLALARRLLPDLVLLDMQLPDMHGTSVLAALQADPATASLAVVSLSASDLPEDAAIAREAGAIEYWTKPIDVSSFHKDLIRVLAPETPRGTGR